MAWKILVWIPVETEEDLSFEAREEAENEIEHLRFLQPENIYDLEEVEGGDFFETGRPGEDGLLPYPSNGC